MSSRKLVADLFERKPLVYWCDFLASAAVGYTSAVFYFFAPLFSLHQALCLLVAGPALFRVALFMHEIVHFKRGEMVAFKVAWNILAGIPMLIPSFLYESHQSHHNTHHYGTGNDGEYLPLGIGPLRAILGYLAQILFLPLLVAGRFLFLTPLSFLHPRLRQLVLERANTFVINLRYRRAVPPDAPRTAWAAMEVACCLRAWGILVLPVLGLTPWVRVPLYYVIALYTLGLNHLRNLAAHRYRNTGEEMSHADQLEDSNTIVGHPVWTELLFPVGLRYHALHHLYPALPYHNLGIAHRRLMAELPADAPYRRTVFPTFRAAVAELFRSAREASALSPPPADRWFAKRARELAPTSTDPQE